MSQKLFNFIFAFLKLILFIPSFVFFIMELDKSITAYINSHWIYNNGIYIFIILSALYLVVVIVEIIFFFMNKFVFGLYFIKQDNYLIFDFTGIVAFIWLMIDFSKNKSFGDLFSSSNKSTRNALKRISYEEFNNLENDYDKRRALVNGLMNNKIKPEEFSSQIKKLNL